jgi:hypothetical protein
MKRVHFAIVFVLSLLFSGNAWSFSPRDVVMAKLNGEGGISKIYQVNKEQAWEIACAVLRWQKSNRIEEHRDLDYMLTSNGISTCPCKTEVGVWIEPENKDSTRITIITVGRSRKNIFTNVETFPDTIKPDFHAKFQKAVDMVKRGKKLPSSPP